MCVCACRTRELLNSKFHGMFRVVSVFNGIFLCCLMPKESSKKAGEYIYILRRSIS